MRNFLILLLPAIALPTTVNAETHWLLLKANHGQRALTWMWEVPMDSLEECEASKIKATNRENWTGMKPAPTSITGICLPGK